MVRDCCRHRDHAIVEQVIAELKDGPLASPWPASRSTCCEPPEPGVATLRTHLIDLPARIATSARRIALHLPRDWPWQPAWEDLWAIATHP